MATGMERRRFIPDFDTWFGREFPGLPGWRPATAAHSIPIEVTGQDGRYVLRAELPGMDPDHDIGITVDGDLVTVTAEHTTGPEDTEHSEFRYGSFRRSVRLPARIPPESVDASYADGILTVRMTLERPAEETSRRIPVKRAPDAG
ncbi:Hsp20/alpha crystallin family protein [Streptomyces sp. NPDC059442]|uniref:Hsp20/alpha crystallin family protein n=1 Tax=unclassified Streptomyces TaxID=2593676 RepID=UPI0036754034